MCQQRSNRKWVSLCPECSAQSVPAPDGGVIAYCNQDAAVAAEAGLSDGRRAFGNCQCGAPEGKPKAKRISLFFYMTAKHTLKNCLLCSLFKIQDFLLL